MTAAPAAGPALPDLRFYAARFLRRLHYFLLVVIAVAGSAVVLAYTLPPVYRAQARLLVEAPQIPGDLAASTVRGTAGEVLAVIQQRLMTRANLLEISRRYGIHAEGPVLSPDRIVADMQQRITLLLPSSRESTGVVLVSFDAPTGALSAQVANELVTQILQQNIELRTAVAGQTLDFFEQEVQRLNEEMADQGARILAFKLENQDALPESLAFRQARQAAQQERALQIERELSALRERRSRLLAIYERTGRIDAAAAALSPQQRQLQELKDQLASAMVIYSPQNPRVRTLQAQVAALEEALAAEGGEGEVGGAMTAFDLQVADIDTQIAFLADQKEIIEAELQVLAASIEATPGNSIALGTLERDYENTRTQYNTAVARMAEASVGDRIEATAKGQRITVIEQAVVPEAPAAPKRRRLAAMGVLAGIGLGLGLVLALEMMNRAVRRPVELTARLGITPFGTVPFIRTRREILWRRVRIGGALALVGIALPAGLYLLHLHYLPMDLLLAQVMEKAGLAGFWGQLRQGMGG
ncbi:MAG TPA: lipopolysaccharide biosynthesis protein [Paracoccaceae bacterium]|nr:lipopolysaccharide biosynthesis protein [Paracoccaceae bacterium]HMO70065.1 lipopolysaccharide biosynthesis protein [Paracoccaceae bacterium]